LPAFPAAARDNPLEEFPAVIPEMIRIIILFFKKEQEIEINYVFPLML